MSLQRDTQEVAMNRLDFQVKHTIVALSFPFGFLCVVVDFEYSSCGRFLDIEWMVDETLLVSGQLPTWLDSLTMAGLTRGA